MKAIMMYYIAIGVFLLCLVVIIVKVTFWPVCATATACDGWTVSGLSATLLGVAVAFLGILGALAIASWWTGLDKRVEDRVQQLFNTRIQQVQDHIDQLDVRASGLEKQMKDQTDQLDTRIGELTGKMEILEKNIPQLEGQMKYIESLAQIAIDNSTPGYERTLTDRRKLMDDNK